MTWHDMTMPKYILGPLYVHYKHAHLFPHFPCLTLSDWLLCLVLSLSIIIIFRPERDKTEDSTAGTYPCQLVWN